MTMATAQALEAGTLRWRALALLDAAAARHPDDPALAEHRAELQLRLGRPTAAAQTVRTAAAAALRNTHRLTPSASLLQGRALEAAGKDQEGAAQYRRCAAAGSIQARVRLGRLLVRMGQREEGRATLEAAHRLAPADPEP